MKTIIDWKTVKDNLLAVKNEVSRNSNIYDLCHKVYLTNSLNSDVIFITDLGYKYIREKNKDEQKYITDLLMAIREVHSVVSTIIDEMITLSTYTSIPEKFANNFFMNTITPLLNILDSKRYDVNKKISKLKDTYGEERFRGINKYMAELEGLTTGVISGGVIQSVIVGTFIGQLLNGAILGVLQVWSDMEVLIGRVNLLLPPKN